VTKAMTQAGVIAVASLLLLLALWLRNIADILYVLLPVLLAGLLTVATSILVDQPLNFANVIALPLLFGLGVASGTHFVMRAREEAAGADLFLTSTPRASVFSTLTTIFSFASLAVSNHRGIQSMGILLAVAILWTLIATLVLLPALFELAHRRRLKRQGLDPASSGVTGS
jgi:predicted RND superfamily exporter protein